MKNHKMKPKQKIIRYKYSRPGFPNHPTLSSPGAMKFISSEINKEVPDTLKINDPNKSHLITDRLWQDAIIRYSMNNENINNIVRNKQSKLYDTPPQNIKEGRMHGRTIFMGMNHYGDTIPAGTVLYRGIKKGKYNSLNDPGIQSWTTDELVAIEFAGPGGTILRYVLKNDIKGINRSKNGYNVEEEVILKPRHFMKLSESNVTFHIDNGRYPIKLINVMRNKKRRIKTKLKRKGCGCK